MELVWKNGEVGKGYQRFSGWVKKTNKSKCSRAMDNASMIIFQ